MKKLRVYLDTSALGGCFDEEFSAASEVMFEAFRQGKMTPLVSETLLEEVERAPKHVRELLDELLDLGAERLETSIECLELQESYISEGVIGRRYAEDALHVAQATFSCADVIASWNFKHLVRPERIQEYNRVNQEQGFAPIVILTPSDIAKSLEANEDEDE